MPETQNPTPAPVVQDPAAGGQNAPQPTPAPTAKDSGGNNGGEKQTIEISIDEFNKYKRDAGRWQKHVKRSREERRASRQTRQPDYDPDKADPDVLDALRDRDERIESLSSELKLYQAKEQLRDLLDSEEYKDLPATLKRAITRNPLGFANPQSQSVDEVIADIQDYLDDELDKLDTTGNQQTVEKQTQTQNQQNVEKNTETEHQAPPATGSGPGNPPISPQEGIDGKTGPARSVTVLENLFKNKTT